MGVTEASKERSISGSEKGHQQDCESLGLNLVWINFLGLSF
jgi:hypothetical protein